MERIQHITAGLLVLTFVVMLVNFAQFQAVLAVEEPVGTGIIPRGVPDVYGAEIGVSYDDVSPQDQQRANLAIRTLANLDRTIQLEDKERYVRILYTMGDGISCEYCCNARAVIFEDGRAACGCAHSYAMRGVAKYLITEHGEDYTDEEILTEVGKWKTLFFPVQMQKKADLLEQQGIEPNYMNVATNLYRGIEAGTSGVMVGGC